MGGHRGVARCIYRTHETYRKGMVNTGQTLSLYICFTPAFSYLFCLCDLALADLSLMLYEKRSNDNLIGGVIMEKKEIRAAWETLNKAIYVEQEKRFAENSGGVADSSGIINEAARNTRKLQDIGVYLDIIK